jgi:hypothetical protein
MGSYKLVGDKDEQGSGNSGVYYHELKQANSRDNQSRLPFCEACLFYILLGIVYPYFITAWSKIYPYSVTF